jgi:hypothetical protein
MPAPGRPRLVSKQPNAAKLFVDDRREVIALSSNENKHVSVVIRELVHEALRTRRIHSLGRDEGDDFVRKIHRETIEGSIGPLASKIDALCQTIGTFSAKFNTEVQSITTTHSALAILITEVLKHVLTGESITKVLMTVGMQKDNVKIDEIKSRLNSYDEDGDRQAHAIAQKILAEITTRSVSVNDVQQ